MKKYRNPEIEIIEVASDDVITTSPGTETSTQDDWDGNWEISSSVEL